MTSPARAGSQPERKAGIGSPAAEADIQGGSMEVALNGEALLVGDDILTHVNGERVNTPDRLARACRRSTSAIRSG